MMALNLFWKLLTIVIVLIVVFLIILYIIQKLENEP